MSELRKNIDAHGGIFNITVEDLGAVIDSDYELPIEKMIFTTNFSSAEKAMFALKLAKLGDSDLVDLLYEHPTTLLAEMRSIDVKNQQTAIELLWVR